MNIASSDIWHITYSDMTLRILTALVLGGLIGFEREVNNHAAGFRTHILVCVGSATIMLLSIYGFGDFAKELNVRMDPARLAAQVITGIGFLGAGAIIRTGSYVSGLTTAASIWVVAAIGLCVGAGFYYGAILASFLVLISLFVFNKWEKYMWRKYRKHEMNIEMYDRQDLLGQIVLKLGEHGVLISTLLVQSNKEKEGGEQTVLVRVNVKTPRVDKIVEAVRGISAFEGVISVDIPSFSSLSGTAAGSVK
ncbi:MgtC/SapB family protein [Cohnella cholangitidis]|uniref:MgtC/SapB family protein n=1 Tax=Cohnella cholangitidis TaxID=2598458 RepID=A0A7G5C0N6_9BACL|nr:MgtC/SapB family protein [Cohnella cholangitidis]QMV42770.1 MgtC/SapB family protein [Cohnella cholangitidis]